MRRTGRTLRLMLAAIQDALSGKTVVIVLHRQEGSRRVHDEIRCILDQQHIKYNSTVRQISIEDTGPRGKIIFTHLSQSTEHQIRGLTVDAYFIDHYVYENLVTKNDFNRYDWMVAQLNAQTGRKTYQKPKITLWQRIVKWVKSSVGMA